MSRVNLVEETFINSNNSSSNTTRSSSANTSTRIQADTKLILNPSKAGFFLKNLRRRSKTYSGEELKSHLDKKISEQKMSCENRSESRLKVSPPMSDKNKRFYFSSFNNFFYNSLTLISFSFIFYNLYILYYSSIIITFEFKLFSLLRMLI